MIKIVIDERGRMKLRQESQEDIGIDLHDAYQKALAMHEAQKRGGG